jgi:hypothetical protein
VEEGKEIWLSAMNATSQQGTAAVSENGTSQQGTAAVNKNGKRCLLSGATRHTENRTPSMTPDKQIIVAPMYSHVVH